MKVVLLTIMTRPRRFGLQTLVNNAIPYSKPVYSPKSGKPLKEKESIFKCTCRHFQYIYLTHENLNNVLMRALREFQ